MTRHRSDNKQSGLRSPRRLPESTFKVQKPTERTFPDAFYLDRDLLTPDGGRVDVPFGPAISAGRALEQIHRGRHGLAIGGVWERICWDLEEPSRLQRHEPD